MSDTDTTETPKGYEPAGQWGGKDRWRCTSAEDCAFDSLREPVMVEHVATAHTPVGTARVSPIVGPDGQPIVVLTEPAVEPEGEVLTEEEREQVKAALAELEAAGLGGLSVESIEAMAKASAEAEAPKSSGPSRPSKES